MSLNFAILMLIKLVCHQFLLFFWSCSLGGAQCGLHHGVLRQCWLLRAQHEVAQDGAVAPWIEVCDPHQVARLEGLGFGASKWCRMLHLAFYLAFYLTFCLVQDRVKREAPNIRCILVHASLLCKRGESSRSQKIRFLKQFMHKLVTDGGNCNYLSRSVWHPYQILFLKTLYHILYIYIHTYYIYL